MKRSRFFSVFLLFVMFLSLFTAPHAAALEEPPISCKAALLVDSETGAIAYAKNEHEEMYPASLTKIMTALLTLEAVDSGKLALTDPLTASESALSGLPKDGSNANIQVGETLTVEQLLYCMMVVSANEACNILAEGVAGSVNAFVSQMNLKAKQLGCDNTHFANANGLHDPQHYTSAWDLYLITSEAMKHPAFMTICDTGTYTIPPTNKTDANRTLHTTNYLIDVWRSRGYINKEAHGIKTGSTSEAGHCLVSSASRGSLSFISVLLGGDRVKLEDGEIRTYSFYDTNLLFNWVFDNFTYKTVLESTELIQEVPVELAKIDHVTLHPAQDIELLLPRDVSAADLERVVTLQEGVEAPVSEGQVLGELVLQYRGRVYANVDLLALNDIESDGFLVFARDVKLFFAKTSVRVTIAVILVLLVLLLLWKLIFSRRRYRYGRSVSRRNSSYRGRRR